MAVTLERARNAVSLTQAMLLAATVPLFLGALSSDIAYARSAEIQWSNFASWLLAGALLFCGFALLTTLIALLRSKGRGFGPLGFFLLVLVTWVLGFIDALVHAQDAWAMMPEGPVLSGIVAMLACIALWMACFFGLRFRSGATP